MPNRPSLFLTIIPHPQGSYRVLAYVTRDKADRRDCRDKVVPDTAFNSYGEAVGWFLSRAWEQQHEQQRP